VKRAVLILLAAVVAVSGCTTEELATEQDLQDQTGELKQHTEQQLEEDNDLVRKIHVKEIEFDGTCENQSSQRFLQENQVYDRDEGIQEFQSGSYLVKNGIDLQRIHFPDCGYDMEVKSLSLDSVSYNKSVLQNGSVISSASETCYGYEITEDDLLYDEDEWEYDQWLEFLPKPIYEECLGIPVDSWRPLGGDSE
jgi:hypothetical protein